MASRPMSMSPSMPLSLGPGLGPHTGFHIHQMEDGWSATDDSVRDRFAWLAELLRECEFTPHPTRFYTCIEEPRQVVQICGWDAFNDHYVRLHTSPLMFDILDEFGGVLDVKGSWHSSMAHRKLPDTAPFMTLARFWVPRTSIAEFEESVHAWLPTVASRCCGGGNVSHGWRYHGGWLDRETYNDLERYAPELVKSRGMGSTACDVDECEEWNLLLPWKELEDASAEFDGVSFTRVLEHVAQLQVKHIQPLQVDRMWD